MKPELFGDHVWWAGAGYRRRGLDDEPLPWPGVKRVPVRVSMLGAPFFRLDIHDSVGLEYTGCLKDTEELYLVIFDAETDGRAIFFHCVPALGPGQTFWLTP